MEIVPIFCFSDSTKIMVAMATEIVRYNSKYG